MYIDSHCHLDLPEFSGKQKDILSRCWDLGIERVLVPGLSLRQFDTLMTMKRTLSPAPSEKQTRPFIDICLGCHPYFLTQMDKTEQRNHEKQLFALAENYSSEIIAVGECGLDGSISLPMDYQQQILRQQINLAKHIQKPLVLHHRQSHNALIRCLKQEKFTYGGIIHAFSGSQQIAQSYIDMGFLLGVGGTITYPRAVKTRTTISATDINYLVLETDAPDMPLNGFQGQINSPERIPSIAACLADLKQVDETKIAEKTTINYLDMFIR